MDLRDAVAYHMLLLSSEGARPATLRNYLHYGNLLLAYFDEAGNGCELDAITPSSVRAALDWYRQRIGPNASRGGEVAVRQFAERIKTFVNRMEEEGILPYGTLRRFRPPRVTKLLRQPFERHEVYAMWQACAASRNALRDEALFLLLLDTGMRVGEASALTLDSLHLRERFAIVGGEGKSRRERLVPLGDGRKRDGGRVLRAIHGYLKVRPNTRVPEVFISREGYPLSAEAVRDVIKHLGAVAGVDNAIPHRLRHTMATWYLVEHPGDELGLREIIGHVSKSVLADYVHFSHAIVRERAGRASLAEQWLQERGGVPAGYEHPRLAHPTLQGRKGARPR